MRADIKRIGPWVSRSATGQIGAFRHAPSGAKIIAFCIAVIVLSIGSIGSIQPTYAQSAMPETAATTADPSQAGADQEASRGNAVGSGTSGQTAQNVSPASIEEDAHRETVLVAFTFSAPDGVEDDIAKDHKLELVSKLGLPTLGLRIIRYAVPDSRPLATVLARLRADQRVSSAQVNIQYRELEPAAPETVVGSLQKPPLAGPRKTAARKAVERREASIFGDRRPARSARIAVGDVMTGGL